MEPASEVLLVLVLSAVIQCSRVISKLLLDKLVSCQDEGLEVQLAEIRYGPLGAVLLNGSDWACWVGLSKLCYLDEMAADEQTEFKSGVCVCYSSLMNQLLFWGLYSPCSWEVWGSLSRWADLSSLYQNLCSSWSPSMTFVSTVAYMFLRGCPLRGLDHIFLLVSIPILNKCWATSSCLPAPFLSH